MCLEPFAGTHAGFDYDGCECLSQTRSPHGFAVKKEVAPISRARRHGVGITGFGLRGQDRTKIVRGNFSRSRVLNFETVKIGRRRRATENPNKPALRNLAAARELPEVTIGHDESLRRCAVIATDWLDVGRQRTVVRYCHDIILDVSCEKTQVRFARRR